MSTSSMSLWTLGAFLGVIFHERRVHVSEDDEHRVHMSVDDERHVHVSVDNNSRVHE